MKFYIALLFIAFLAICSADESQNDSQNEQAEIQDVDVTKEVDKRIPHPSWRSKGRVQYVQQGEMPPFAPRQFSSFNGGPRFYRYGRRPFSFDLYDF